jgi:hypothetical protein
MLLFYRTLATVLDNAAGAWSGSCMALPTMITTTRAASLLAPAWLPLWAQSAWACPSCPTARAVRASVLGEGFWMNVALVSLPAVVLAGISALLYRVGKRRSAVRGEAPVGLER